MFRKFLVLLSAIAVMFTLSSCGLLTLLTYSPDPSSTPAVSPPPEATPTPTPEPTPDTTITIGSKIVTDRFEITINNIQFSYDVVPESSTYGYYSHYEADSGKVYIHIDTDVKNIQKQNLDCDDVMRVRANYNDGFKYTGSAIVEDGAFGFESTLLASSLDPLETKGIHYLIECPQEVEETDYPLQVIFTVDGTNYTYTMR